MRPGTFPHARIFPLRIEKAARVERLLSGEQVAEYWQDATRALTELTDALNKLFRDDSKAGGTEAAVAERRYVRIRHTGLRPRGCERILHVTDRMSAGCSNLSRIFVPIRKCGPNVQVAAGSLRNVLESRGGRHGGRRSRSSAPRRSEAGSRRPDF